MTSPTVPPDDGGEKGLEPCPFHVGDIVTVHHPKFGDEWPGEYRVTGIQWEYRRQSHPLNISIASDDTINARCGDTDGWRPEHLRLVRRVIPTVEGVSLAQVKIEAAVRAEIEAAAQVATDADPYKRAIVRSIRELDVALIPASLEQKETPARSSNGGETRE